MKELNAEAKEKKRRRKTFTGKITNKTSTWYNFRGEYTSFLKTSKDHSKINPDLHLHYNNKKTKEEKFEYFSSHISKMSMQTYSITNSTRNVIHQFSATPSQINKWFCHETKQKSQVIIITRVKRQLWLPPTIKRQNPRNTRKLSTLIESVWTYCCSNHLTVHD